MVVGGYFWCHYIHLTGITGLYPITINFGPSYVHTPGISASCDQPLGELHAVGQGLGTSFPRNQNSYTQPVSTLKNG